MSSESLKKLCGIQLCFRSYLKQFVCFIFSNYVKCTSFSDVITQMSFTETLATVFCCNLHVIQHSLEIYIYVSANFWFVT
jgi:hypothetical protein